ncbi:unnamed protein product [Lathyrus sativus]|nr:unnamed protein product [Lathyrus sativus]
MGSHGVSAVNHSPLQQNSGLFLGALEFSLITCFGNQTAGELKDLPIYA